MKKVIYLYKSGTLSRQDSSLVLKDKAGYCSYIPIEQIDTLICFGEVTLNKRTFSLLNIYHVSILFFNFYGQYIGRFSPKQYVDGKIMMNQVLAYSNLEKRTEIAYTIIKASISNELSLLKYYRKKSFDLNIQISQLEQIIKQLKSK